jgi:hypothetical protein
VNPLFPHTSFLAIALQHSPIGVLHALCLKVAEFIGFAACLSLERHLVRVAAMPLMSLIADTKKGSPWIA